MGLTFGQLIGSVGGAVIGGMIGGFPGAMIGMSIGGTIGGWIDPPPSPAPPPLGDIGINSFVHNAPIPLAYGQNKTYGGVIFMGDMMAGMSEGGSKKSKSYTPWMSLEFAVGHCEGEVESYEKYWVNDKEIDEAASEGMHFTIRSYDGNGTQTVDPDIDDFLSGAEAPAVPFRWTAYSYVWAFWDGGIFNTVPSFCAEIKGLLTESGEEDANPIRVLYDFLTNERYGCNIDTAIFDGDPDTVGSSWKAASDYCDETVSYVDEDDVTQYEPRFRYSNVIDQRTKGYDIVKDILMSCRGIISWCQGLIYVKIESASEDVTNYFSDEYIVDKVATGSSTVSRVYFSTSITEPTGFWEGAYLEFEYNGQTISEMVHLQGTDYVDLVDNLPVAPPNLTDVSLTKDNIKEGTFNWNKTPSMGRYNSIRVEFINRKWLDPETDTISNQYQWDAIEHEQPDAYQKRWDSYDPDISLAQLIQQQVRIQGIKRKSQAMRMAKWFADCATYLLYYCEFVTDIVGYLHKVGDIVAITHSQLGWQNKEFRIVAMEELGNDEIKLSFLEYNRFIYGDDILQVITSSNTIMPSVYIAPDDLERVNIVQDLTENQIWCCFKRPDNNNWWLGAQIWLKKSVNESYEFVQLSSTITPSVKLDGAIDDSQTVIPFDETTLYSSFPDAGSFWIEDELITYTSIDAVNYEFEGCTRGSNASAHATTEYCHLKQINTPNISFDDSDVGSTWYFKLISQNIVGLTSEISSAVENSVTIA